MSKALFISALLIPSLLAPAVSGESPLITSMADPQVKYTVPSEHFVKMQRGDITVAIVDNHPVDNETLPGHREGYSGVALLRHRKQPANLFVPAYAGLNFEHIHDGTTQPRDILFEPRKDKMQLRVVDPFTVELYQPPTKTWGLESCHRYRLLADGTIEMVFECIPRRKTFRNGYVGLFWASYINQPASLDIHFRGRSADGIVDRTKWIRGVTPKHGVRSTHVGRNDKRRFRHDEDFPLSLVFNRSPYVYDEPWYYGVSGKMAAVYMFRPQDQVRLTQSPSGGGRGNPAWDFQYLIDDYKLNQGYQFVMRMKYVPFESESQIDRETRKHRSELRGEGN